MMLPMTVLWEVNFDEAFLDFGLGVLDARELGRKVKCYVNNGDETRVG